MYAVLQTTLRSGEVWILNQTEALSFQVFFGFKDIVYTLISYLLSVFIFSKINFELWELLHYDRFFGAYDWQQMFWHDRFNGDRRCHKGCFLYE